MVDRGVGAKDARLAVDLVTGVGGDLPVIATARDQYQKAAELSPGEDIAAVAKIYRR
jgi:3-hydroxyisobutyrate dehydrogenase-like beta-hydroxyacid dehydrogenase